MMDTFAWEVADGGTQEDNMHRLVQLRDVGRIKLNHLGMLFFFVQISGCVSCCYVFPPPIGCCFFLSFSLILCACVLFSLCCIWTSWIKIVSSSIANGGEVIGGERFSSKM